jgi:hypothetical protein
MELINTAATVNDNDLPYYSDARAAIPKIGRQTP